MMTGRNVTNYKINAGESLTVRAVLRDLDGAPVADGAPGVSLAVHTKQGDAVETPVDLSGYTEAEGIVFDILGAGETATEYVVRAESGGRIHDLGKGDITVVPNFI